MKIVILQSNYIPWRGYFDLINSADVFCFYDEVQYTKNDWRNRNKIYTKNGLLWMSIPIAKNAVKQKISEVEILDTKWQQKHFKTFFQSYKNAPQFENILPLLEEIYVHKTWKNLSELNQFCIKKICEYIRIETKLVNSNKYDLSGGKIEKLVNLIIQLEGNTYISGPSGRDYLQGEEDVFTKNGIELIYKSYDDYPSYTQHKVPFENHVSILDLLFFIPRDHLIQYISNDRF